MEKDFDLFYAKEAYEERINYLNDLTNFIENVNLSLTEYEYRLFFDGLSKSDIKDIRKDLIILKKMEFRIKKLLNDDKSNKHKRYLKDWYQAISYQVSLLYEIGEIGKRLYNILKQLEKTVSKESLSNSIINESSLLHLISTNNHSKCNIPLVSDDAYKYNCQFHVERTPSMRVNNHSNTLYCYGCGKKINVIDYIMVAENISKKEAIYLLAAINRISIPNNPYNENNPIVKKYCNAKSLKRYELRVKKGKERALNKKKTFNNFLALEKFDKDLETLRRIRNNEYLKLNENKNIKKVYRLKMPNFHNNS